MENTKEPKFILKKIKDCNFDEINAYITADGLSPEYRYKRLKNMHRSIVLYHASWASFFNEKMDYNRYNMYWQVARTSFESYKEELSDNVLNTEIEVAVEE